MGRRETLADGSTRLTLRAPVTVGTERVESLTFRKMRTADMRRLPAGDADAYTLGTFLDLAADLASVPPSTIDALEIEDGLEVAAIVGGFFFASLATGASASGS